MAPRSGVADVRSALAKIDAGRSWDLTQRERIALSAAQGQLHTRKPLAEYAARTRRRYLGALERGETATGANRTDRQRQQRHQQNRAQRIESLRLAIVAEGLKSPDHSASGVEEWIDMYGEALVEQRLREQLDDIHAYQNGDPTGGRRRIEAHRKGRGRLRLTDDDAYDSGEIADAMYWYHGTVK